MIGVIKAKRGEKRHFIDAIQPTDDDDDEADGQGMMTFEGRFFMRLRWHHAEGWTAGQQQQLRFWECWHLEDHCLFLKWVKVTNGRARLIKFLKFEDGS